MIPNDHESDFETLFQSNNDVCNSHRNIQTLLIEIFKNKNGGAANVGCECELQVLEIRSRRLFHKKVVEVLLKNKSYF